MRLKALLTCLVSLLITACSAGGPHFTAPSAPEDRAVLWLFRPSTVVGAGNTDYIGVNNQLVARLEVGEYARVPVAPGPVVIKQKQVAPLFAVGLRVLQELAGFGEVLSLTVQPGKNYFIEFSEGELVDAARAGSRIGTMTEVPLLAP